jgi:hypothetical protein
MLDVERKKGLLKVLGVEEGLWKTQVYLGIHKIKWSGVF